MSGGDEKEKERGRGEEYLWGNGGIGLKCERKPFVVS